MAIPNVLPAPIDLGQFKRGDTVKIRVTCQLDGLPLDLTHCVIWMTFKTNIQDNDLIAPGFQLSSLTSGITVVGLPEDGVFIAKIDDIKTASLVDTTQFTWDVQIRDTDLSETYSPLDGVITFVADITRATS